MLRAVIVALAVCLAGCAARVPVAPAPGKASTTVLDVREGIATYYGPGFHGKTTASGARFDMNAMVAAHPSYPFGTVVRVTNLENDRSVSVRILDRGPAARIQAEGIIIDVSQGAAERLGFIREGRARVRVEVLEFGDP
jgi:rare lipoprotein A